MGDVAVWVVDGVALGLRETTEGDQIRRHRFDADLLSELSERRAGEAAAGLGRPGRQLPGGVVATPGKEDLAVAAAHRDHHARH